MMQFFDCPMDGESVAQVTKSEADAAGVVYGCQTCKTRIESAPDVATMTREDRAAELDALMAAKSGAALDVVWQRVDQLVGRGTMTHELAYPEYLRHEILTGVVPSLEGIVAKFPHGVPVIVVAEEGAGL